MADAEYTPGQIIMQEGAHSDYAYIILQGKVEVYRKNKEGQEEHLAFLGKDQMIGEYGVLDGAPRSASVRAITHTQIRRLDVRREHY
jgi:CRP-like cAMP-binding protein